MTHAAQPGVVQSDAKVVGCTLGIEVGPEKVEQLCSMAGPTRFQSKQLDNGRGTPLPPNSRRNQGAIDSRLKPTQKTDL